MNDTVFTPKHNWFSIIFLGFIIALLGAAFSMGGFAINNLFLIIFGLGLVFFGFISIAGRSKLIIIRATEVVMKRLFLPKLVFPYESFTDFNDEMFMFGNRGIPLQDMTNSQEFVKLFSKILEERNIRPTGKYIADVQRTNKALKYSFIPALIASLILTYLLKTYLGIQIDGRIIWLILFLITLFGVYFILKRREEME